MSAIGDLILPEIPLTLSLMLGACGVAGYSFMGVYKEILKVGRASIEEQIAMARLAQGEIDVQSLSKSEKAAIVSSWLSVRNRTDERNS